MNNELTRRTFMKRAAAFGAFAALGGPALHAANAAGNKLAIAVIGTGSRGMAHIAAWLKQTDVEIAYVCDTDSRAVAKAIKTISEKQKKAPKGLTDFRKALEDKNLDAVSIATPNHWHAPAAILACSAGKHAYVEKPGSHNPHESEMMVKAAEKNRRLVQMGNQRRSWPVIQDAIARVHAGEIGEVNFARCWYNNKRGSIGKGKPVPVPEWLDYSMWQGPAPERPFVDNLVHYNWHWRWHWGNGELGNNGVHSLDLARWGMKVEYPVRVTCCGGRYHFQDDQETPDVYNVGFDFGNKGASWEGYSCDPRGLEAGDAVGTMFLGSKGTMIIGAKSCRAFDLNNKQIYETTYAWSDVEHFANFCDAIRKGASLASPIAEGQKSALLCHLGNIAYRTGHTLNIDPKTGKVIGDSNADALWSREYRPGWEPKV